jgi:hypothetical protein
MIERASLVIAEGDDCVQHIAHVREEFPTVVVRATRVSDDEAVEIDASEWHRAATFDRFERVMRNVGRAIAISGPAAAVDRAAIEVLTRFQRYVARRNRYSSGRDFDRLLVAHRRAHELDKPLVAADYDHALDIWQWVLRLEPQASAALQIAGLLHEVEQARELLLAADVDREVALRVAELLAHHERPGDDRDLRLLNDADALSFFSLNSEGYLRYFGAAQTRRKVAYTFGRLSEASRSRLAEIRLTAEIASELERCRS